MRSLFPLAVATAVLVYASVSAAGEQPYKFPDARESPPDKWAGPVFHLRSDYPENRPAGDHRPWKEFDPKVEWKEYLASVLNYAMEGNVEVDWDIDKNAGKANVRQWYHAPWMHWGRNGREPIHGLTHERVAMPGDLAYSQTDQFQNWAVSIYNPAGGYVIGQVWKNRLCPDPSKARFPDGAVSIKLLFTQATEKQVPYLHAAKEWDAYIYKTTVIPTNPRMGKTVQTLRLLQIDVAVRDERVDDTTGWVFGTFVYNGLSSKPSVYERMEPVGLMWGNDPTLTVAKARQGQVPKESIVNHSPKLPFQHLGWAGRLNGPVDNPVSSCLSCHATAQVPDDWKAKVDPLPLPPVLPDSEEWLKYFANVKARQPFSSPGWQSLDYSLQLSNGILNFREWVVEQRMLGGSINRTDMTDEELDTFTSKLLSPENAQIPRVRKAAPAASRGGVD